MDKETYIKLKKEQENIITTAKTEITSLGDRYIEMNRIFEDGDKIRITTPRHQVSSLARFSKGEKEWREESYKFAFVKSCEIDYWGKLKYILKAIKKDGTEYQKSEHYGSNDILTLEERKS